MQLHDALRNDPELRRAIEDLFEQERQATLQRIEGLPANHSGDLSLQKSYLDALKQVRSLFLKPSQEPSTHATR